MTTAGAAGWRQQTAGRAGQGDGACSSSWLACASHDDRAGKRKRQSCKIENHIRRPEF